MALSGPQQYPTELLDTTMDQLRTLIVVHEAGTALGAARRLAASSPACKSNWTP